MPLEPTQRRAPERVDDAKVADAVVGRVLDDRSQPTAERAEAGRVVVQTFNPGSPAVACAVNHDYARFADLELRVREEHGWPPFRRLLAVRIEGSEAGARLGAEAIAAAARPALGPGVAMLGPAPAALERLRGKSRWQILFRAADPAALRRIHRAVLPLSRRPPGGASVRFDVDPYALL
jgi:primosomal protein N' (replication factor Y)